MRSGVRLFTQRAFTSVMGVPFHNLIICMASPNTHLVNESLIWESALKYTFSSALVSMLQMSQCFRWLHFLATNSLQEYASTRFTTFLGVVSHDIVILPLVNHLQSAAEKVHPISHKLATRRVKGLPLIFLPVSNFWSLLL